MAADGTVRHGQRAWGSGGATGWLGCGPASAGNPILYPQRPVAAERPAAGSEHRGGFLQHSALVDDAQQLPALRVPHQGMRLSALAENMASASCSRESGVRVGKSRSIRSATLDCGPCASARCRAWIETAPSISPPGVTT